jgi:predicted TIM-barrel fold metal-dependent hydrolase
MAGAAALVIDFHTHIYPASMRERKDELSRKDRVFNLLLGDLKAKLVTAEELVNAMDDAEVDQAVVLNAGWTTNGLCKETNDYILDAAVRFPGRLIPFCTVQLRETEKAVVELERCIRGGARGLGEMRADEQGFDLADRTRLQPVMEIIQKHDLIFCTHSSEPVGHMYPGKGRIFPPQLLGLAAEYPDVRIVCAHWGGGLPFYGLMPEVMNTLENVWFDTAASPYLYNRGIYRLVTSVIGFSKVLYGSDYPLIGFKRATGEVRDSGLTDEMIAGVLGENARRLLTLKK